MKQLCTILSLFVLLSIFQKAESQPVLSNDYSFVMNVPHVAAMASSPAHFYVLSESEGMAVFRARPDSLQWLYSSTGMQRRGSKVVTDIRFAYLFGNDNRLTVLEPTSVMGVYSSTRLAAIPLDVQRIGRDLFIALGSEGLAKIPLKNSSSGTTEATTEIHPELEARSIISLASIDNQLFALTDNEELFRFNYNDEQLELLQSIRLSKKLFNLFFAENSLFGTDGQGNIYEIDDSGKLFKLGSIDEEIIKIAAWRDWLIIRGTSGRIWTSFQNQKPKLWKDDAKAGNYFAVSKNQLWISEYNQITKVRVENPSQTEQADRSSSQQSDASLKLGAIQDYTVPHSESLLFPISYESNLPVENIRFTYQSPDIQDAVIRGQSFYWKPSSDDIGTHKVKVIASTAGGRTSSTSFNIHVRSFNAPPRFTPIRSITIPVDEAFSLSVNAVDPDGIDKNLIRFMGVNLPKGASINESTGTITWTPSIRQVGENTFRVIATDQYGAAASIDVTINVSDSVKRSSSDQQ